MADLKFIAQGGFNSGRLYSAEGQRIFWAQREDGWLFFRDIDRMVAAWIKREGAPAVLAAPVLPGWLMRKYDFNLYDFYPVPARDADGYRPEAPEAPEDFDFGPQLRI